MSREELIIALESICYHAEQWCKGIWIYRYEIDEVSIVSVIVRDGYYYMEVIKKNKVIDSIDLEYI